MRVKVFFYILWMFKLSSSPLRSEGGTQLKTENEVLQYSGLKKEFLTQCSHLKDWFTTDGRGLFTNAEDKAVMLA